MAVSSGVALVFIGNSWGGRSKGWMGWDMKGWPASRLGWPMVGKGWRDGRRGGGMPGVDG